VGYREWDQVVYPVGADNGIDPMYSEHVHNIPYSLPSKELDPSDPRRQYVDGRKRSTFSDPGWARAPRILLVEDDPTCRQIGSKFLYSFRCVVDTAVRLSALKIALLVLTCISLMVLKQ
jgi:osomolarity two-component system, response regulator SKN7